LGLWKKDTLPVTLEEAVEGFVIASRAERSGSEVGRGESK
jgi:hypothetical protein